MAGNPVHPAAVHFPITFIAVAGLTDILYVATTSLTTEPFVATAFKTLGIQLSPEILSAVSYYASIFAVVTALPAVITGALELLPLINRDGYGTRKVQTGLVHGLLSDVAIGITAYNWWSRRAVVGFAPSTLNVALSGALAMPLISIAAGIGGDLVYTQGMGVGRSRNKGKKTQ